MTTKNAVSSFRRLMGEGKYPSLAECRGQLTESAALDTLDDEEREERAEQERAERTFAKIIATQARPPISGLAESKDRPKSAWLANQRRLCSFNSGRDEWSHDSSVQESAPPAYTLAQARIRRMANFLSEETFGGTHLPGLDLDLIENLLESAAARHQMPAAYTGDAIAASRKAHGRGHTNAKDAADDHRYAQRRHMHAAKEAQKAGNHDDAKTHARMAFHHEKIAKHHELNARDKVAPLKKADAPAAKAEPKPEKRVLYKAKAPPMKHDPNPHQVKHNGKRVSAADVDAARKQAATAQAAHSKTAGHSSPSKKEDPAAPPKGKGKRTPDEHSLSAHNMTMAHRALVKDQSVSHKELHQVAHKASQAHMAAALHHFKGGNHEKAMADFHLAIHDAGHAARHKAADADLKHRATMKKNEKPSARAAVGMTGRS